MKKVKNVILVSIMLLAAVLYSCDKEIETSPLTVDNSLTGTIKGYVFAELDLTSYGKEAVAGKKVVITVAYSQLGLSSTKGNIIDTVETANDGSFEFTPVVDLDGADVIAKVLDFTYAQKQPVGSQYATIEKIYAGTSTTFSSVKPTEIQIKRIDLAAPANNTGEVYEFYTISGQFKCDRDLFVDGDETVPADTKFTFSANGTSQWSKEVTLTSDGKFSVSVPAKETISVKYNFTTGGKNASNVAVTFRFQGSFNLLSYTSDTKDQDRTLAAGTIE
jgi:hypothetical protein